MKEKRNNIKTSLKEKVARGYMAFAKSSYEGRTIRGDIFGFWKKSCGSYKFAIILRILLFAACLYGSVQLASSVGWFFLYFLGFGCLSCAAVYGIETLILNWTYGSKKEFYCKFVSKMFEDGGRVKICETPEDLDDYKYKDTIVEEETEKLNKKEEALMSKINRQE